MTACKGRLLIVVTLAVALAGCGGKPVSATSNGRGAGPSPPEKRGATRHFRFVYGATIEGLAPGATARVWLPLATTDPFQTVTRTRVDLPGEPRETTDGAHGNRLLYFEATADDAGEIPLEIEYDVLRREVGPDSGERPSEAEKRRFLVADAMVPDGFGYVGKVLGAAPLPTERPQLARALYDAILEHMRYEKPADGAWGRGDARWACDARYGNCTDFHSLLIGMAREKQIPGRFEIGFPIPADAESGDVGGYHCWAWLAANGRWTAVDVSEADKHPELSEYYYGSLTADRVTFTTGRDLTLDPPQEAGPVNFLVYPYVEVDGRPHTKFRKRFSFRDVDEAQAAPAAK